MTARALLAVVLLACATAPFRAPEIADWRRRVDALTDALREPVEC
jgi:hypothetical protein